MDEKVRTTLTSGLPDIGTGHGALLTRCEGTTVDYAAALPHTSEAGRADGAWTFVAGGFDLRDEFHGDPADADVPTLAEAAAKRRIEAGLARTYLGCSDVVHEAIDSVLEDEPASARQAVEDKLEESFLAEVNRLRKETAKEGETVAQWYSETYPSDDLADCIDPQLGFSAAADAIGSGPGFYTALGVGDSVVRERVFSELAARLGLSYGDVYDSWYDCKPLPSPSSLAFEAVRAVVIPCGGEPREVAVKVGEHGSTLEGLQDLVGGLIEPFGVLAEDLRGAELYVNDSGLFECPANRAVYATDAMAEVGYLSQLDYKSAVRPGDLYTVLHGDIVAVGLDEGTGRSASLTDEQVAAVTDYFTKVSGPGSGEREETLLRQEQQERRAAEMEVQLREVFDWMLGGADDERSADDGRDEK